MAASQSTPSAKYNQKDLVNFRKEISSFGLDVLKYSRKGVPAPRTLILSTDPLELYWVGKGGKRNQLDLGFVTAVRTGFLLSEGSELTDDHLPSDIFKKHGVPGNANLYVSLHLEGEPNGRKTFDVETGSAAEAKKLHSILVEICPNVVAASKVLVGFPNDR